MTAKAARADVVFRVRGKSVAEVTAGLRAICGVGKKPACVGCGCTEDRACPGSCYWSIAQPFFLCSTCYYIYTSPDGPDALAKILRAVYEAGRRAARRRGKIR